MTHALLDDNLYPPAYNVRQGKYRGVKHASRWYRKPGLCVTRTVVACGGGWYRGQLLHDGWVVSTTDPVRARAAAWELISHD